MLKKGNWQEREFVLDACHDSKRGNLWKEVIRNWDKIHLNVSFFWCTTNLRSVFQDMTPPKSILRKSTDMPKANPACEGSQRLLHVIRKFETKIPSLGYICPGEPHERSPNAPKFEVRSQEETEWQEQVPAKQRGSWPKMCLNYRPVIQPCIHRCHRASTKGQSSRLLLITHPSISLFTSHFCVICAWTVAMDANMKNFGVSFFPNGLVVLLRLSSCFPNVRFNTEYQFRNPGSMPTTSSACWATVLSDTHSWCSKVPAQTQFVHSIVDIIRFFWYSSFSGLRNCLLVSTSLV